MHFPRTRWTDLQRGLAEAMTELGFSDLNAGAEWLLSAPLTRTELDVLASHLTIGETYFFREKRLFEILRAKILPQLIDERRKSNRRLRIWSAACCTGEEPYSLAILLKEVLHDLPDWNVTILATDINSRFLKKAIAASYRDWSFRETPVGIKDLYFKRHVDGSYELVPEIKNLVTFAQLNLVEDIFPSLVAETNAMDLIFCRNVLMYFSPAQARRVVTNLYRALVDGGWLVVSPSETSQTLFKQFLTVNFPGSIVYRRASTRIKNHQMPVPIDNVPVRFNHSTDVVVVQAPSTPVFTEQEVSSSITETEKIGATTLEVALSFYEHGEYAEAVKTLLGTANEGAAIDSKTFSLLTRALADQGKLADALLWCDRWVEAEKLNANAHYLRAIVLQELGDIDQSRHSLQRAIYIDPDLVLPHFALGNLALARGKLTEARKHFANALSLLRQLPLHDVLPESDGLTAGRLIEIITSIIGTSISRGEALSSSRR
ncbi:MAG TPA: CheR family methyltransferase [Pyrinomonadaceae bacterium]|nr:CheR family methyltransferase [Pyrinomonadaceae bacterium]